MDAAGSRILERLADATQPGGRLPIIALTRRGDLKAKLAAFERGVDDILTVPFSPEEFVARVLAIMRRTYRDAVVFTPVLRLGDLEIDILNRRVRAGDTELHLTSLEQSLLYLLAANAGRLLTRDEILDHLWGADYVAESNVVDRHIRNLRVKLQNHSKRPRYIATVPGRGYRFVPTPAATAQLDSRSDSAAIALALSRTVRCTHRRLQHFQRHRAKGLVHGGREGSIAIVDEEPSLRWSSAAMLLTHV